MIFPIAYSVLGWLQRPGGRTLSRAAMEVAFRGMRKILCVAEKNDAAKGIADLLSNGRMTRVRQAHFLSAVLGEGGPPNRTAQWAPGVETKATSPTSGYSPTRLGRCNDNVASLRTDRHLKV